MPLLDLSTSVINNLVNNGLGMRLGGGGLYIFYYDMKEACKGYGCVIRPT